MKQTTCKYLLTLPQDLFNRIEDLANEHGESIATIIRQGMREYLDNLGC